MTSKVAPQGEVFLFPVQKSSLQQSLSHSSKTLKPNLFCLSGLYTRKESGPRHATMASSMAMSFPGAKVFVKLSLRSSTQVRILWIESYYSARSLGSWRPLSATWKKDRIKKNLSSTINKAKKGNLYTSWRLQYSAMFSMMRSPMPITNLRKALISSQSS